MLLNHVISYNVGLLFIYQEPSIHAHNYPTVKCLAARTRVATKILQDFWGGPLKLDP